MVNTKMTDVERRHFWKLIGNVSANTKVIFGLLQFKQKNRSKIFNWLIKSGVYGNSLYQMFLDNGCSTVRMGNTILKKVDAEMKTPLTVADLA